MGTNTAEQLGSRQFCSECGRPFPATDLVRFGSATVCADCKPAYVQRMREGVGAADSTVYGGFWRRFLALVLDAIFLSIAMFPIRMGMSMVGLGIGAASYGATPLEIFTAAYFSWATAISFALGIAYQVFFISQKGATLGKMIMGVKVVTANGGPVSVGRAFGRYFACYLSGLTLCIGYIIAAFDDQKRALHDHICNTRVIRD
jgi:uncharacterized RDD family membrane protein YckC